MKEPNEKTALNSYRDFKLEVTDANGKVEISQLSIVEVIKFWRSEIAIYAMQLDPKLEKVLPLNKWFPQWGFHGEPPIEETNENDAEEYLATESVSEYFKIYSPDVVFEYIQRALDPAITNEVSRWRNLRDVLYDEVKRRKRAKEQKPKRKRQTQKLTPLDSEPYMYMASDKATKFFINSLMPNQTQPIKEAKLDALEARGISIPPRLMAVCVKDDDPKFAGLVSYNTGIGESVFKFFQEKSPLAVKAHFALWARAHRETKAEPGKLVKMTISQFCDDLGFQKKKRAHTRENKQHALQILETLTSAEMILLWQDPQKKLHRTKGNVWQRGLSDEVFDTHINDTNGQNENLIPGTEKFWDPKTFSYSPGGFFTDADWRKFNNYVGLVGQGLLKLGIDNKDKAAVLIGGYIAFLARIENYDRKPLKLTTLIENTGDLLTGHIDRREAAMLETIVENALQRLIDVKVLKDFEWVYDENIKPSDFDKTVKMPELLARRIRLFFPDELAQMGKEYKELETVHRKKAAAKKAKAEQVKAKRK